MFLFLQNRGYCFHNNSLYFCLLSSNHKPLFSADKFAIFFKENKSNLQFSACFGCIKTIAACPIQENRSMKNSSSVLVRYNKNALEKVHNNRSLSRYFPNPTFSINNITISSYTVLYIKGKREIIEVRQQIPSQI